MNTIKRILSYIISLSVLMLTGCAAAPRESGSVQEKTTVRTEQETADRLPNVSDTYKNHIFFTNKNYGSCVSMTGKVLLTMIMVDDDKSVWTDEALNKYKYEQIVATQKLQYEAEQYGANLTIQFNYLQCRIDGTVSMESYSDWAMAALAAAGLPDQDKVTSHLKEKYGVKEAPIMFCVNYPGRSFGIEWNQGDYFEYAVLYSEHADYRHELNHMFGAVDFYQPDSVRILADKYLSHSIMNDDTDQVTDGLTAYLIGWTDTLTPAAKSFIEESAWITEEYLREQREMLTSYGYGTVRYRDGTYTGELLDGLPHGQGKMVWNDGNTYEGSWLQGKVNGYATMRYGDGTYTGDVVDGVPHGQGKMVWDDGNTYEGGWLNGSGSGYGVFIWNTLNCSYEGEWVNWKMHGYGTFTYDDGSKRTGLWNNDDFVG